MFQCLASRVLRWSLLVAERVSPIESVAAADLQDAVVNNKRKKPNRPLGHPLMRNILAIRMSQVCIDNGLSIAAPASSSVLEEFVILVPLLFFVMFNKAHLFFPTYFLQTPLRRNWQRPFRHKPIHDPFPIAIHDPVCTIDVVQNSLSSI